MLPAQAPAVEAGLQIIVMPKDDVDSVVAGRPMKELQDAEHRLGDEAEPPQVDRPRQVMTDGRERVQVLWTGINDEWIRLGRRRGGRDQDFGEDLAAILLHPKARGIVLPRQHCGEKIAVRIPCPIDDRPALGWGPL